MRRYLTIGVDERCAEHAAGDGAGHDAKSGMREKCLSVEQVLRRQGGFSKRQVSHAKFLPEGILKNGKPCRVTECAEPGDRISICLEEAEERSAHLVGGEGELDILYEDEDLLAVNKPAGLVTHPQGCHYRDSLANQAAAYFREKNEEHCIRPVGRLDRDTSGVVIFAKNKAAAARLQGQRESGVFSKTYLAVVCGKMPVDGKIHRIQTRMMQDAEDKRKMVTAPEGSAAEGSAGQGKRAVTYCRVLASGEKCSLVLLTLETGRTHQIRVHMAGMGHPLVGDPLYGRKDGENGENDEVKNVIKTVREDGSEGGKKDGGCGEKAAHSQVWTADRALLHAWKVELRQPFGDEVIRLTASVPDDVKSVCCHLCDVERVCLEEKSV